jgi:hypothetical protein
MQTFRHTEREVYAVMNQEECERICRVIFQNNIPVTVYMPIVS